MFQFQHTHYLLYLLMLLPIIATFVGYLRWRQAAIARIGDKSLVQQLMPFFSEKLLKRKAVLFMMAWFFLVISLANPQLGTKFEKVKRRGVDVIIALDISQSMMAEDVKPNRIERAKQLISRLLDRMSGDRVGLIIFAGHAYLQTPLTTDYGAVKSMLKITTTDLAPTQGTAIGEALNMCHEAFNSKDKKFKAVIVISDGETHDEDAIQMAKELADEGVKVLTVGVGSQEGAEIPRYEDGQKVGVKEDLQGKAILSKLNEQMIAELADAGNGRSFHLTNDADQAKTLLNQLSNMEKREFEDHTFTDFDDHFQWFLFIAFALLVWESFTILRKKQAIPH
ncbi:MAG: VWA domain-containing protein [Bacteroidia bacterium]